MIYGFWGIFLPYYMKPKWYTPGIISLLGILPLLLWKTNYLQERFDQKALNVYLPKEGDFDDRIAVFSEEMVLREVKFKKITTFYLNDFIEQRKEVIKAIGHTVQEMKFGYDTSRVVKVVLGQNCSFNDLVSVLNISLAEELRRYAWVQDSIFIFAHDPPRQEQYAICAMQPVEYLEIAEEKNWMRDAFDYFKSNKLIISGLLTLFLCGLFQIILSFRTNKNASGILKSRRS